MLLEQRVVHAFYHQVIVLDAFVGALHSKLQHLIGDEELPQLAGGNVLARLASSREPGFISA